MPISQKLLSYLDANKIKYEIVEHKTVFTAMDVAKTEHLRPEQILKTLVMKLDSNLYVLASLSAGKNLDKAKLKNVVNAWRKKNGEKAVKSVDFAKEAWMKKNLFGKVGATPPFGKLLKLPAFVDAPVLKNPKIFVNAGDYNYSLKIAAKQYEKSEEPVKGSFSIPKPKVKKAKKKVIKKAAKKIIKKGAGRK